MPVGLQIWVWIYSNKYAYMSARIKTEANKAHKIASMCVAFEYMFSTKGNRRKNTWKPEILEYLYRDCQYGWHHLTSISKHPDITESILESFLSWLSLAFNIATNSLEAHLCSLFLGSNFRHGLIHFFYLMHLYYVSFPSWPLPLIHTMPCRDNECFPLDLLRFSFVSKIFSTFSTYDVNSRSVYKLKQ